MEELGLQLDSLLETGSVAGELCDFVCQWEEFCARLEDGPWLTWTPLPERPIPWTGSPGTSWAKQLPGYGGLETAVFGFGPLSEDGVLGTWCWVQPPGPELLQTMLRDRGLSGGGGLPAPGHAPAGADLLLAEGNLPRMEYPTMSLAVLTEGQGRPGRRPREGGHQPGQSWKSYADLSPGDLVVHEHHGVGRYMGMVKLPGPTGWRRTM